jgi:hypothetical protein
MAMRARLTDPNGPAWTRLVVPMLALAIALGGVFAPWSGSMRGVSFCVAAALFFIGPLVFGRRRTQEVELDLGAGCVEVKGCARTMKQTIRAADVYAASAARSTNGVGVAIVRGSRNARPIVLDLPDEDGAKAVRDALGIGHFGLGILTWPTARRPLDDWTSLARVVGAATWLTIAATVFFKDLLPLTAMASMAMPVWCLLMIVHALSRTASGPCVVLEPLGVNVNNVGRGFYFIPYPQIAGVRVVKGVGIRLELHGAAPFMIHAKALRIGRRGLSHEEREHVAAQILSASQRAHGAGAAPHVVEARVADLAKGSERARAWLARIDTVAEMLTRGPGYRGAGFEETELWATLEDHDAPSDVRAAAARVLVRVAPDRAPARVESVIAAVRDEPARARIRIAIDPDVDAASAELDEIEAKERIARHKRAS